jgi:hypothetical protein
MILYNNPTKLPSLKWTLMVKNEDFVKFLKESNGVSRWKRREEERIVIFFISPQLSSNLLTMTKVLVTYPPLDQSQKSKLKL